MSFKYFRLQRHPHYKVKTMQLWSSIFYVHKCNAFVGNTMKTWDYNDPPNLWHLRASSISRTRLQQTSCLFLLILQWFRALLLTTQRYSRHIPLTPPCKAHSRGTQAMSSHYFSWTESLWIQQLRNHYTQKIRKTHTHTHSTAMCLLFGRREVLPLQCSQA